MAARRKEPNPNTNPNPNPNPKVTDTAARLNEPGKPRCRVATNAGYFNTHHAWPKQGGCFGNIVTDGVVVQHGLHRNVNFGLLADGRWAVGYYNVEDWGNGSSRLEQVVSGVVWLVRDGVNYVSKSISEDDMEVQETGA